VGGAWHSNAAVARRAEFHGGGHHGGMETAVDGGVVNAGYAGIAAAHGPSGGFGTWQGVGSGAAVDLDIAGIDISAGGQGQKNEREPGADIFNWDA